MREYKEKEIAGQLAGQHIILEGANGQTGVLLRQELLRAAGAWSGCKLLDGLDFAQKGDYVLLFTDAESGGNVPVPQRLLEVMTGLCAVEPASVLLVSDAGVYGRFYGDESPRREAELGYVGHTRPEDIPLQRMRLAEHMACRLAREAGLPVKVVRVQCGGNDRSARKASENGAPRIGADTGAGDDRSARKASENGAPRIEAGAEAGALLSQQLSAAIKVLLYGKNGEIYNLPGGGADETEQSGRSPLSPQILRMDTGKVEKLSCCETI